MLCVKVLLAAASVVGNVHGVQFWEAEGSGSHCHSIPTFSMPFFEFSGFTKIEGGADAGGLGGGSLLTGISLPSMMRELAAEWLLVLPPLLIQAGAGSPGEMGLDPTSTIMGAGEEVIPCGRQNWSF